MQVNYYKEYSHHLNCEMEYKVYGHSGKVCIVFPAQDGRFYDYENFKMVDALSSFIEEGRLQLWCIDSVDKWSWSLKDGNESERIELHERWFNYICEEIVGTIRSRRNYQDRIITTGCSMGATHALNFFLRRPDIFGGVIALSGVYNASFFFPNYHDERIFYNSITDYMAKMPSDHYYLDMYRNSKIMVCIGQGRWEDVGIGDTRYLDQRFKELNVPAWFDYWGFDVDHDWPWWLKQIPYFMSHMLED